MQNVSWIPVDVAARAVFDMRHSDVGYLHLAHPRPVAWSAVMGPLAEQLHLPLVSYDEWLARLTRSGEGFYHDADSEVEAMRHNPALKILDFFTNLKAAPTASPEAMGLPPLDTSEAQRIAPALSPKKLPKLSGQDAVSWIAYWKKIGFL